MQCSHVVQHNMTSGSRGRINVPTRETQNQMGGNVQHGRLGQNPHKLCNVIPSLQVNL